MVNGLRCSDRSPDLDGLALAAIVASQEHVESGHMIDVEVGEEQTVDGLDLGDREIVQAGY